MADVMFGLNQIVELPSGGPQLANDATVKNIPGMVIRYNGKIYRYVQFDDGVGNVAAVAAGAAHWKTLTPASGLLIVTSDQTNAIGGINTVAGILGCVVTDQYYTWIQVGGPATVKVQAGTIASDCMIGSTTDLTLDRIASGATHSNNIWGVALDTRETTYGTATILLQNLVW
jgi:hypothetical protein